MKELEKSRVLNHPEMVDVVTADGMFSLHLLSNLPETSELSRSILRKLCSSFSAKRIDNVFDKVVTPSIKDNERDIQAQGFDKQTVYEIFDPFQKDQQIFLEIYATTHSNRH